MLVFVIQSNLYFLREGWASMQCSAYNFGENISFVIKINVHFFLLSYI